MRTIPNGIGLIIGVIFGLVADNHTLNFETMSNDELIEVSRIAVKKLGGSL